MIDFKGKVFDSAIIKDYLDREDLEFLQSCVGHEEATPKIDTKKLLNIFTKLEKNSKNPPNSKRHYYYDLRCTTAWIDKKEWKIFGGWDVCYRYPTGNPKEKVDMKNEKSFLCADNFKTSIIRKVGFYEKFKEEIKAIIKLCKYCIKSGNELKIYTA